MKKVLGAGHFPAMPAPGAPGPVTPRVDHLCIFVLAVEWIMFGSCHFVDVHDTILEVPPYIPFKMLVAVFTGMVEVTTGILLLLPQTRKIAAGVSLALLSVFLLAIYNIIAYDSTLPDPPFSPAGRAFVRVILVPNHVFLILAALHLWRTETKAIGPAQVLEGVLNSPPRSAARRRGALPKRRRRPVGLAAPLTVAAVMLLANLAGFLAVWASAWNPPMASLWAMMCLAAGALVGFLFGVPRVNADGVKGAEYRPNSNIEVVSDWLTKIIVGVGLVEFRKIGGFLGRSSTELGKALAPQVSQQAQAASFALALIVYFFVAGIIQGYLLTRMYLSKQFEDLRT